MAKEIINIKVSDIFKGFPDFEEQIIEQQPTHVKQPRTKYDYGRKKISKHTGLTGVEAGHIAQAFKIKGLDIETVDWETIGQDLYGHGKRVGGVKHHLREMYGIDLGTPESEIPHEIHKYGAIEKHETIGSLMQIHESRSRLSIRMDLNRAAKGTFQPTDIAGVKKWKKNPNRYDIIGVDDPVGRIF